MGHAAEPGAGRGGSGTGEELLLDLAHGVAREAFDDANLAAYEAALAGRDIYYDQRHPLNLEMRDTLEAILRHAEDVAPEVRDELTRYTKLFWINTGPYNFLTARKVRGLYP